MVSMNTRNWREKFQNIFRSSVFIYIIYINIDLGIIVEFFLVWTKNNVV